MHARASSSCVPSRLNLRLIIAEPFRSRQVYHHFLAIDYYPVAIMCLFDTYFPFQYVRQYQPGIALRRFAESAGTRDAMVDTIAGINFEMNMRLAGEYFLRRLRHQNIR